MELLTQILSKTTSVRTVTDEVNTSWEDGTFGYEVRSGEWQLDHKPTVQTWRGIEDRDCEIHGIYELLPGYQFAYVPTDAIVEPTGRDRHIEMASYGLTNASISIVQTVYASVSIYRA